jgi:cytochrome c oxidase cbb3-type subunit 3
MSSFWSWFIIIIVLGNVIGYSIFLYVLRKNPQKKGSAEPKTTGHVFDGIEELNNPLPRWWLWLFWITIVFTIIYLALYPGLGNFKGILNWTSDQRYQQEATAAEQHYGELYADYYQQSVAALAENPEALKTGQRLFVHNCASCHGVDGRGGKGFPNLTDSNWQWGNAPEEIETTILNGRRGMMPAFIAAIGGEEGADQVVAYVRSLNGHAVDAELAALGKTKFTAICSACHGADAKGNKLLGAPNLTNNQWVHGGSEEAIKNILRNGLQGVMPAHKDLLGEEKVRLLAAYVYHLSQSEGSQPMNE